MRAINIKTEYLKSPIGIDISNPRIFWNCDEGITQTAYRIVTDDYDSGKVKSDDMSCTLPVKYQGGKRVDFKIRLWDENDNEGEWATDCFEYGIDKWRADWITGDYKPDNKVIKTKNKIKNSFFLQGVDFLINAKKEDKVTRYPVDCFKHSFNIDKEIKKARLYITACGLYEAKINDKRVGSFVLAPGITDYKRRIQYQTYDVTEMLTVGKNDINVDLADGWYRGTVGAWGLLQEYGFETKFIAQLEMEFADGNTKTVISDSGWQWSNDGPIRFADNKDGEIVDANMTPSYSGKARVTSCNVTPTASNNVYLTEKETFKPTVIKTPAGKTVLDFGQNMAGYIQFAVNAKKGEKLHLRFGEMFDEKGEFTQKNIQTVIGDCISPKQEIVYTCKDGLNEYKTRFAIFGFRYVLVESNASINPDDFTAIAVYSDMEQIGFFDSSNELLNKLVHATVWSTKSNSADLPTDCPTRERHGWTGDAQIFFGTASYLFDYASFSKKFLTDIYDWQNKDGKLPQIAPEGGIDFFMAFMNGSVGWSDIGILLPYFFWKKYQDTSILTEYYDRMVKYADFMITRIGKNALISKRHSVKGADKKYIVNKGQAYGEWAEPTDVYPNDWKATIFPQTEVATAYTSYVLSLMSEIAAELGKKADADKYNSYSNNCKKAYGALVDTEGNELDTDRQAKLVRPLYMSLLNEDKTKYAKERLIKALDNYGWRLGTGFLSTPFILYVLQDIDINYAYRLLENEKMPGWLFMPKMGATTIWESWEGTEAQGGIASLNHYSKGAVCQWLFDSMCGINVSGKNHFVISPKPGGNFAFANAEYKSVFGKVKSGWKKTDGGYTYEIVIPSNTTAEIILPSGKKETVSAGSYTFND